MKTKSMILSVALVASACASNPRSPNSERLPAGQDDLLIDLNIGNDLRFLRDFKTSSPMEFVAFSKSGQVTFKEPASVFGSNANLMKAAQQLNVHDSEVVCAVGFHPEHRRVGGFLLSQNSKHTITEIKGETGAAGGWAPSKSYSVFRLDQDYILKCATVLDGKKGYSAVPTVDEARIAMDTLWQIEAVAATHGSVPKNQAKGTYIELLKSFSIVGSDSRLGIKKGNSVAMSEIFFSRKACYFKGKGLQLTFKAGEVINIDRVFEEDKTLIFDSEFVQLRCGYSGAFIHKALNPKDVSKVTEGFLKVVQP